VVLPFANLTGDPEQEYFVDGVTDCLTTDLSRISGSFVIARNTAFTYKGKPFEVKQIGRELSGSRRCGVDQSEDPLPTSRESFTLGFPRLAALWGHHRVPAWRQQGSGH
jgi:hypothetical protein